MFLFLGELRRNRNLIISTTYKFYRGLIMTKYQEMAVKVYHKESATMAAKQTAYQILINSGWSQEDIRTCKNKEPRKHVMIFLA